MSGVFSNKSQPCHKCSKSAFPLEQIECCGKIMHEVCFTCEICNQKLSPNSCGELEERFYCMRDYYAQLRKLKIPSENSSQNITETPDLIKLPKDRTQSSKAVCSLCHKRVFNVNGMSITIEDKLMHKACFSCCECQEYLTEDNYHTHEGQYFCAVHYIRAVPKVDEKGRSLRLSMTPRKRTKTFDAPLSHRKQEEIESNVSQRSESESTNGIVGDVIEEPKNHKEIVHQTSDTDADKDSKPESENEEKFSEKGINIISDNNNNVDDIKDDNGDKVSEEDQSKDDNSHSEEKETDNSIIDNVPEEDKSKSLILNEDIEVKDKEIIGDKSEEKDSIIEDINSFSEDHKEDIEQDKEEIKKENTEEENNNNDGTSDNIINTCIEENIEEENKNNENDKEEIVESDVEVKEKSENIESEEIKESNNNIEEKEDDGDNEDKKDNENEKEKTEYTENTGEEDNNDLDKDITISENDNNPKETSQKIESGTENIIDESSEKENHKEIKIVDTEDVKDINEEEPIVNKDESKNNIQNESKDVNIVSDEGNIDPIPTKESDVNPDSDKTIEKKKDNNSKDDEKDDKSLETSHTKKKRKRKKREKSESKEDNSGDLGNSKTKKKSKRRRRRSLKGKADGVVSEEKIKRRERRERRKKEKHSSSRHNASVTHDAHLDDDSTLDPLPRPFDKDDEESTKEPKHSEQDSKKKGRRGIMKRFPRKKAQTGLPKTDPTPKIEKHSTLSALVSGRWRKKAKEEPITPLKAQESKENIKDKDIDKDKEKSITEEVKPVDIPKIPKKIEKKEEKSINDDNPVDTISNDDNPSSVSVVVLDPSHEDTQEEFVNDDFTLRDNNLFVDKFMPSIQIDIPKCISLIPPIDICEDLEELEPNIEDLDLPEGPGRPFTKIGETYKPPEIIVDFDAVIPTPTTPIERIQQDGILRPEPLVLGLIGYHRRIFNILAEMMETYPHRVIVAAMTLTSDSELEIARTQYGDQVELVNDVDCLLLREEIKWIFIASNISNICEISEKILESGKNIFCEQPRIRSISECTRIKQALCKNSLQNFVSGFVWRTVPFYDKIQTIVSKGCLGDILTIEANHLLDVASGSYLMANNSTFKEPDQSLIETFIYDIDLLCWITNNRPSKVITFSGLDMFVPYRKPTTPNGMRPYMDWREFPIGKKEPEDPFCISSSFVDNQLIMLEFEGMRISLHMNIHSSFPQRRILICGTQGTLEGDLYTGIIRYKGVGDEDFTNIEVGGGDAHGGSDNRMIEAIMLCAEGDSRYCSSVEEIFPSIAIVSALSQSKQQQKVEDMNSYWEKLN